MRSYPRSVFKDGKAVRVYNENEEKIKADEGYESSSKPDIVALRKGTDKEILRGEIVVLSEAPEEEEVELERVDPVTGEEVIPEEEEVVTPKKRVRRTKAQIEADKNGNSTR